MSKKHQDSIVCLGTLLRNIAMQKYEAICREQFVP